MTTDTSQIISPPSVSEYEALRDSIATYGQQRAILLAHDGSIIDGNLRMRACGELGIVPDVATVPDTIDVDPLTIEAFALLHNRDSSRHPVPAERDRIVLALHQRGMTMREIVAATGASKGTVGNALRHARTPAAQVGHDTPDRRIDSRGRAQRVRRTTPGELARRDALIVELHRRGHSHREIGEALDVAQSVIGRRLDNIPGVDRTRRRGAGPITEPCLWRDDDMPTDAVEPRWRRSRVVAMAQMFADELRESNFANVLANQTIEALAAGDDEWHRTTTALLDEVIEKASRARRVLVDADYRTACRDHEGFETLRDATPRLRAVP